MSSLQVEFSWTAPGALDVEFNQSIFQCPLTVICQGPQTLQAHAPRVAKSMLLKDLLPRLARSDIEAEMTVCSKRKLHFEIISGDLLEGVEHLLDNLGDAACFCGEYNEVVIGRSSVLAVA